MKTMPLLTVSKLEPEAHDLLTRMFACREAGFVEVNPGRVVLPATYMKMGQNILDMEVRDSDVWLCSYPRTGSTWAQEMTWLIGNDLDYEGSRKSLHKERCPRLEVSCFQYKCLDNEVIESGKVEDTSVDLVKLQPNPRYVRTHLPWDLLPVDIESDDGSVKPKVIYTFRNPKDVVVSFYHYCTLTHKLNGTFEEFCDLFIRDRAPLSPFWDHILGFWRRRNDPNVLFIKYEEMKRDLPSVVRRTAQFLNKELTDTQVDKLCDHLSFKNMKTNPAVNFESILEKSFGVNYLESTDLRFIRKGEIGDWKNYMSDELSRRFDEWAEQHLKETDLNFE